MMKVKVNEVKCGASEIEIDVKDELSDLVSQCDDYKRSYDGNFKVIENTEEVNENKPQRYGKSKKCESSKVGVMITFEDVSKVNETDETCNNNKRVMKIPESYVKIQKINFQEVAVSFDQKLNNNQAASKANKSRSTTSNLTTFSLLAKPRSEVQAPLTAFFLPTASSEQTDGPVDSALPARRVTCFGLLGTVAPEVFTTKSSGVGMDMQSQPEKRRQLAAWNQPQSPMSTLHSGVSPLVKTPAAGTLPPSQVRARPGNVPPRLARCSSRLSLPQTRTQETHPRQSSSKYKNTVHNSIPVDSSDLPDGWRMLRDPRNRHYAILPSGPSARKLMSQKDVDAFIEDKDLNINIKLGGQIKIDNHNSISVDSSDLPDGWRRFKVPRSRHYTILTSRPDARKLRSKKDVDTYIEEKELNINIKLGGKIEIPIHNSIPVDSSDLPEGWRRFKVPRREHLYDLYILTSGPGARKLRSENDVDAYVEENKLNPNIRLRPWLTENAPPEIPPPSQPLQVNIPSGSFHPAPSSPARLLPEIASNDPSDTRPVRKLPTLNQPAKTAMTPTPCSPVLPLPTLAKALASLGGKEEGSKKLVLFHLSAQQIEAFNTLGVKEVGIVE